MTNKTIYIFLTFSFFILGQIYLTTIGNTNIKHKAGIKYLKILSGSK